MLAMPKLQKSTSVEQKESTSEDKSCLGTTKICFYGLEEEKSQFMNLKAKHQFEF